MTESAEISLHDGIRYLRGGSMERAWTCFECAAREASDPAIVSEALRRQGDVKRRRGEWTAALELCAAAVAVAEEQGLKDHAAAALNIAATVHLQQGEFAMAIGEYERALAAGPTPHQQGLICQNLGTAFALQDQHEQAEMWYARSSAAFGAAGHPREQILALINQGSMQLDLGDIVRAQESFELALGLIDRHPLEDTELEALVEVNIAEALARQELKLDEAYELLIVALGHFSATEDRPHQLACHRIFALISERQGRREVALEAMRRGLELARQIGSIIEAKYFERELSRLDSGMEAFTLKAGGAR